MAPRATQAASSLPSSFAAASSLCWPDAIENGVSGRLVPPGDARALADALASFQERADLAARLGREAARRSRDVYVWPRVVEAYEGVYDEVLGLASFAPEATAVARGRW